MLHPPPQPNLPGASTAFLCRQWLSRDRGPGQTRLTLVSHRGDPRAAPHEYSVQVWGPGVAATGALAAGRVRLHGDRGSSPWAPLDAAGHAVVRAAPLGALRRLTLEAHPPPAAEQQAYRLEEVRVACPSLDLLVVFQAGRRGREGQGTSALDLFPADAVLAGRAAGGADEVARPPTDAAHSVPDALPTGTDAMQYRTAQYRIRVATCPGTSTGMSAQVALSMHDAKGCSVGPLRLSGAGGAFQPGSSTEFQVSMGMGDRESRERWSPLVTHSWRLSGARLHPCKVESTSVYCLTLEPMQRRWRPRPWRASAASP